jgi:nucleotide-binding universal stress UspA family protein
VKAYRRIVVGVDFSRGSQGAIGAVEAVAGKGPVTVYLIHVLEPPAYLLPPPSAPLFFERNRREDAELRLKRLADALKRRLGDAVTVRIEHMTGLADVQICKTADRVRAHLIIVGSHGRSGFRRALVGSIAERVARLARRPVLIVPLAGTHRL